MSQQGSPSHNTITTITDVNGEVVVDIKQNEYLVLQEDGSFESNTHYQFITLVSGENWAPQMMWQKPPVRVGVCAICRTPSFFRKKAHGLTNLAKSKTCRECGVLTCRRHSILCSDGYWRCPRCARWYKLRAFITFLFFSESDK